MHAAAVENRLGMASQVSIVAQLPLEPFNRQKRSFVFLHWMNARDSFGATLNVLIVFRPGSCIVGLQRSEGHAWDPTATATVCALESYPKE